MATHLGTEGYLHIDSTTVGEIRGYTLTHTSDTVEDTVIGDDYKTRKATLKDWRVSGDLYWDEADAGQVKLIMGATVTVDLYPEGVDAGDTYYQGQAIVVQFDTTGRHDSMVEVAFSCDGTGELTTETVP